MVGFIFTFATPNTQKMNLERNVNLEINLNVNNKVSNDLEVGIDNAR